MGILGIKKKKFMERTKSLLLQCNIVS